MYKKHIQRTLPYIFASLENLVRLSLLIEKRMPKSVDLFNEFNKFKYTVRKAIQIPRDNLKCSGKPDTGTIHEIFRVVSRFPCYISCYIAES